MSHRSLFWPITLIVVVAVTLVMVFTNDAPGPRPIVAVAADVCPTTDAAYETCYKTATAAAKIVTIEPAKIIAGCPTNGPALNPPYPPYADCQKTRTALLLQTERAGASATPTAGSSGGNSVAASTATPTQTFTATPTATVIAAASATPRATSTSRPTPSATPTATLSTDALAAAADAAPCIPGDTMLIEGSADPATALIVTFGDRPVGGGFTSNDGSYRIRLRIGDERPGIYHIQVQDRATRSAIQELNCQVPAFTPTPTPSASAP